MRKKSLKQAKPASHDIIQRGAEAILYLRNGKLVKERISKGYRISQLDSKIRKSRTRSEAKLMERARSAGAKIPRTSVEGDFGIVMEYLEGDKLKDVLNGMAPSERTNVCERIGETIACLHSNGIIHGDLTTSNMILKGDEVYLIDFGLGKFSEKVEDQAVDLFLLYEALKSTHFLSLEECWKTIVKSYSENFPEGKDVMARIEKIKNRRRYK
jgi:Kae1-associated kinase Bud32